MSDLQTREQMLSGLDGSRPQEAVATELVARLEAASVGSPLLSADIAEWAGDAGSQHWAAWREEWTTGNVWGDDCHCPPSPYTTSLDAALALAERRGLSTIGVLKAAMHWAYRADASDTAGALARFVCVAILKDAELMASVEAETDTPPDTGTGTEGGR